MPLVLAISEATASGHVYDDRIGVSYEFPTRYRNRIRTGERFVYYRGNRKAGGGRQMPVYLGAGIVGPIEPADTDGRLRFQVVDYQAFAEPLPFRDDTGALFEPGGTRQGYWQPGVRTLSDDEYERILAAASLDSPAPVETTVAGVRRGQYAPPEIAKAVDEYAMRIALGEAQRQFPRHAIVRMPHNNPGHDVRVQDATGVHRYIEVKGTQAPMPRFFMSEGERLFSENHADRYILLVVYAIDLGSESHRVWQSEGRMLQSHFALVPVQWYGEVAAPEPCGA